jgi:preprotein translocase subunit Sss1
MNSNKKIAHIAGALYLFLVVTGIFNLRYVPSKIIVSGDAVATMHNIVAYESLYRWGLAVGFIGFIGFLLLPLVLYQLLRQVNENYARLMVIFAAVSVPISFANMANKFAMLSLVSTNHLKGFDNDALQAQVMLHNSLFNYGTMITMIFWGLWLFPFGLLVFKSGFLPRILGVFLMIGCFGYLITVFGNTLLPDYHELGITSYVLLPGSLGELGTCLWLLIMGVKEPKQI